MSTSEVSIKPPNTTLSPYGVAQKAVHSKEVAKRDSSDMTESQYWRYDVFQKRQKHGDGPNDKLCFKFISSGSCSREDKCHFRHATDAREQFLRGVCFDFLNKGKCDRGPDCNFKHSLQDEGESFSNRRMRSENKSNNRFVCPFTFSLLFKAN